MYTLNMYICLLFLPYSLAYDYCSLKCDEGLHTVCLRKGCEPSPVCEDFKMIGMDDAARQLVLDLHNDYRNQLALGKDTRGENSMVADMRALSYHKELEFVAQCYANACREMGAHDKCRITEQFDPAGQNLFVVTASKTFDFSNLKWIKVGVKAWYEEITDVDAAVIDKYEKRPKKIGHFTQVVWAKTTHVGCGRVTYGNGLKRSFTLYCNYGIGGNVLEDKVYVRGEPCSQCGSEKCNDKYKGLCGDIEPLPNITIAFVPKNTDDTTIALVPKDTDKTTIGFVPKDIDKTTIALVPKDTDKTTIGFVPKDIDKTTIASIKKIEDERSDGLSRKYNIHVIFACIICIILLSLR